MRILRGDPRVWDVDPSAVVIGMLDGVHRGHQALVAHLLEVGDGLEPVVLTFEPHPRALLTPDDVPTVLTPVSRKAELLAEMGIGVMAVVGFTLDFSRLSPAEFAAEYLMTGLDAHVVCVADGFRFGAGGEGRVADLRTLGDKLGFGVEPIAPAMDGDVKISSSLIRDAVARGDVQSAQRELGRPHRLTGVVVEGRRLGSQIGFPTANLELDRSLAIPGKGVYRAEGVLRGERYRAAVNVGIRPTTTGGEGALTVEAHLLDFDDSCYGEELSLDFLDRIRDEQAFDSVDDLRVQIERDVQAVRTAPL